MPGNKVRITISGTRKLKEALSALAKAPRASQDLADLVSSAARRLRDEARAAAPKRTGLLRSAIFADTRRPFYDPDGISVLVGINANRAPHWVFIEYGTRRIPARPFWRPTLDRMTPVMRKEIRRGIYALAERYNKLS